MVTYVATMFAKPGSEQEVSAFYQAMEPELRAAKGFRSRRLLRAKPGTMLEIVKGYLTEEQLADASKREQHGPEGVQFVIVEEWDDAEDRVRFSRGLDANRNKSLYPHLLPAHTHEFYEDISPE